ncbi:MAG TPA: hypothetical protein VF432_08140 [Thermoanaerobaculia bacterium]
MSDPIIDAAEQKRKQHEAEKAQFEAEKAKLEAELALKALQPDETAKALKQAEADKAVAEAKKAAHEADRARIDAARALAASKLIDPIAEATKDAEAQKKLIDAQKGVIDAQQQAWLAKYIGGDVKAGPYTGKVTMDEKAGTVEATLLAMKVMSACAKKIADNIGAEIAEGSRVCVFDAAKPPSFDRLMNYRFRYDIIREAFISALPAEDANVPVALINPAMIAAGLGAVSNIFGFFKTDFSFRGVDVKLESSLALHVVSGTIARESGREVLVPSMYQPKTEGSVKKLTAELVELVALRARATAALATLRDGAVKTKEGSRIQTAIDLHDSFFAHLTTTDANGTAPLVAIAYEAALRDAMEGGVILMLRVEASGGTHFTKEGLKEAVGATPLFFIGGAAVSYALFNGLSGELRAGGVVAEYTDEARVTQLRKKLAEN